MGSRNEREGTGASRPCVDANAAGPDAWVAAATSTVDSVLLLSIDGMHAVDFYNCAHGIAGANDGQSLLSESGQTGRHRNRLHSRLVLEAFGICTRTYGPGLPLELPSHQHDLWRHSGGGWVHSLDRPAPFYTMIAGPGGKGLNDYWAPEVSSKVVALPGVKTSLGVPCATVRDATASSWNASFGDIQCYDAFRVDALLN